MDKQLIPKLITQAYNFLCVLYLLSETGMIRWMVGGIQQKDVERMFSPL